MLHAIRSELYIAAAIFLVLVTKIVFKCILWFSDDTSSYSSDYRITVLLFFIILCYFCRQFIPYSGLIISSALLAMLALMAPMLNFMASVTLYLFLAVFVLPYLDSFTTLRSELAQKIWKFILDIGIVYYLLNIYYNFFVLNNTRTI